MKQRWILILGMLAASSVATPAVAQDENALDTNWYVNTGLAGSFLDESATITVGGVEVPGASLKATDSATVTVEVGYRFDSNWAVSLTGGILPKTKLTGTGPLDGIVLGETRYAPAVLSAHYHFSDPDMKIQPYLGGGVSYAFIFDEKDGAVEGLSIDNATGLVLQAGIESPISHRLGLFVDVKKFFLSTKASGTVGGAPASAKIDVDPTIVSAGLTIRF